MRVSATGERPVLLAVDGNSLLHRAYHGGGGSAEPVENGWGSAVQGLVSYVARVAARLRPHAVVVGFDCPSPEASVRRAEYPAYKGQRPP